jgi:hypothetical protein
VAQLRPPRTVVGALRLAPIAVAVSAATLPVFGQTLRGSEFQINTYTTAAQREPAVSSAASGAFVVVWWSFGQDGSSSGIFGQRYDAAGVPQGGEFRVNTYTTSVQSDPAIATDGSGRFTVTWSGTGPGAAGANRIWARRFASSGGALGPEFEVTSYAPTSGSTRNARIATLANQGFVVTWEAYGDGDEAGIFARRYNSSGVAQGPQFPVNTYTTGGQTFPAVAGGPDGGFVVVWSSFGQDGSINAVIARRYNSAGAPQGGEFQVNTHVTGLQERPSITAVANDGFVVVWDGQGGSDNLGVFARRLSVSGTPYGVEARINTYTTDYQLRPRIVAGADGSFLVVWDSRSQDGDGEGVFGRLFDRSGTAVGGEFQVNTHTPGIQLYPAVSAGAGGQGVVVWMSYPQEGDNHGIFGQRVFLDFLFADGFEATP